MPISSNVSSLDPAVAFDEVSLKVIYQIYETLYEYDYNSNSTKVIPLLADGMPEVSKDKLTYKIKIKKNVKYHAHELLKNQRTVKAQDFVNQIKRIAFTPTRSQGFWLFDGKIKGINKFKSNVKTIDQMLKTKIEGIKALDEHTIQIQLIKPYPQIMYALSLAFVTPIPSELIKPLKNNFNELTIGTGPYLLKKFKRSHLIELSKFDNYHVPQIPHIETIKMPFMKESQTRWLNFRKEKIDFFGLGKDHFNIALDVNGTLKPELKSENIRVFKTKSLKFWWLGINFQDELLGNNLNLRKAIAHAINWDKYIEIFTNNTGIKANSIYHPSVPGYQEQSDSFYKYDPPLAMQMLKLAGYPDGENLPEISFDTRTVGKSSLQQSEFIKSELKKIGIKIKIQTNNFPAFLRKAREGKLQLWQDGWGLDYPDSENIIQLLLTKNHPPGSNSTYYSSKLVDKHFNELAGLEDGPRKATLMKEIESQVKKDYVWIMQFYSQTYVLYNSRIRNYKPTALTYGFYKHLKIRK